MWKCLEQKCLEDALVVAFWREGDAARPFCLDLSWSFYVAFFPSWGGARSFLYCGSYDLKSNRVGLVGSLCPTLKQKGGGKLQSEFSVFVIGIGKRCSCFCDPPWESRAFVFIMVASEKEWEAKIRRRPESNFAKEVFRLEKNFLNPSSAAFVPSPYFAWILISWKHRYLLWKKSNYLCYPKFCQRKNLQVLKIHFRDFRSKAKQITLEIIYCFT